LYLLKSHRRPPTRRVQWLSRRTATVRQLRPSFHGKKVLDLPLDRPGCHRFDGTIATDHRQSLLRSFSDAIQLDPIYP
jgi:hypothetical protein